MAKVVLAFASRSGNTEEIAFLLEENLTNLGVEVVKKEIGYDRIEIKELMNYDGILIGTYTEGDGDIPYETEDFFDDLDDVELAGKPAALFGSCDSFYPDYGGGIDQFEEKLKEKQASILLESLKIELSPEKEDEEKCWEFAKAFAEGIMQHSLCGSNRR